MCLSVLFGENENKFAKYIAYMQTKLQNNLFE